MITILPLSLIQTLRSRFIFPFFFIWLAYFVLRGMLCVMGTVSLFKQYTIFGHHLHFSLPFSLSHDLTDKELFLRYIQVQLSTWSFSVCCLQAKRKILMKDTVVNTFSLFCYFTEFTLREYIKAFTLGIQHGETFPSSIKCPSYSVYYDFAIQCHSLS